MATPSVITFIQNNLIYLICAVVGVFIIYDLFFRTGSSKKLKPLSRSEIERKNFVERNKHNTTNIVKWAFRGNSLLGKLATMRIMVYNGSGETNQIDASNVFLDEKDRLADGFIEMVIRPPLFSKLKITNPFAKELCMIVSKNMVDFDGGDKSVNIDEKVIFDKYFGIFYDIDMKDKLTEHIIQDNVHLTDLENIASIYYVKSQEQSTYNPEYAHELAMREKELQIELAKKRGKQTSI